MAMSQQEKTDYKHFNPHSRKGSDKAGKIPWKIKGISIHTPARGVTGSSGGNSAENW